GVDQREVRQALREVAEEFSASGVDLLGVESDVVRGCDQLVHKRPRLVELSLPRQGVDEPEGAGQERALVALNAVLAAVAVDERALLQLPPDRLDRGLHALADGVVVREDRERQDARVDLLQVGSADVAALLLAPALDLDERPDLLG